MNSHGAHAAAAFWTLSALRTTKLNQIICNATLKLGSITALGFLKLLSVLKNAVRLNPQRTSNIMEGAGNVSQFLSARKMRKRNRCFCFLRSAKTCTNTTYVLLGFW